MGTKFEPVQKSTGSLPPSPSLLSPIWAAFPGLRPLVGESSILVSTGSILSRFPHRSSALAISPKIGGSTERNSAPSEWVSGYILIFEKVGAANLQPLCANPILDWLEAGPTLDRRHKLR